MNAVNERLFSSSEHEKVFLRIPIKSLSSSGNWSTRKAHLSVTCISSTSRLVVSSGITSIRSNQRGLINGRLFTCLSTKKTAKHRHELAYFFSDKHQKDEGKLLPSASGLPLSYVLILTRMRISERRGWRRRACLCSMLIHMLSMARTCWQIFSLGMHVNLLKMLLSIADPSLSCPRGLIQHSEKLIPLVHSWVK